MKFILGVKTGMTQVFDETGVCQAGTVLRVEPNVVTQVKTLEKDGYRAVQLATKITSENRVKKPQSNLGTLSIVREFRPSIHHESVIDGINKGDKITVDNFVPGDLVSVSATSKGKGFQGVVKRHGFAGGRRSHGQKHSEREPGSIGATGVGHVLKGTRMAGRMGGNRVTVKGLKVLQVNKENNTILISGAIPGRKGTLVEIRATQM